MNLAKGFENFNNAKKKSFDLSGFASAPRKIDMSALFDIGNTTAPKAIRSDFSKGSGKPGSSFKVKLPWYKRLLLSKPVSSALDVLQGVGGIITNQAYNWTDGKLDWKDIPLAEQMYNHGKGVLRPYLKSKNVGDFAKTLAGDVFTLGTQATLRGFKEAGKHNQSTADIFKNVGFKQAKGDASKGWNPFVARKGQLDWYDLLGFTGDVLLDPTTYLTFGGSSAVKAGARAATKEAAAQAAKHGLAGSAVKVGGKNFENIAVKAARNIEKHLTDVYMKAGDTAEIAAKKARVAAEQSAKDIGDAAKAARAKAQNALFNIDVPFSNYTKQFGKKPKFLMKSDRLVDVEGANAIKTAFDSVGLGKGGKDIMSEVLDKLYGVKDPNKLTSQMADHFNGIMTNLNFEATNHAVDMLKQNGISDYIINQVQSIMTNRQSLNYVDKKGILEDVKNIMTNETPTDIAKSISDATPDLRAALEPLGVNVDDMIQAAGGNLKALKANLEQTVRGAGKAAHMADDQIEALLKDGVIGKLEEALKKNSFGKKSMLKNAETLVERAINEKTDDFIGALTGISPEIAKLGSSLDALRNELPKLMQDLFDARGNFKSKIGAQTVKNMGSDPQLKAELDALEIVTDPKDMFNKMEYILSHYFGMKLELKTVKNAGAKELDQMRGLADDLRILDHYGLSPSSTGNFPGLRVILSRANETSGSWAHYAPWRNSADREITLFFKGRSSFLHEYMHFMDHYISTDGFKNMFPNSGIGSPNIGPGLNHSYVGSEFENYLKEAIDDLKSQGKYDPRKTYEYSNVEIIARAFTEVLGRSKEAKDILASGADAALQRAIKNSVADNANVFKDYFSDDAIDKMTNALMPVLEKYKLKAPGQSVTVPFDRTALKKEVKTAIQKIKNNLGWQKATQTILDRATKRMEEMGKDFFIRNKFVQDMGGNSALGKFLGDRIFRYINPRTLGAKGKMNADQINSFAILLRDRENMLRGVEAMYRSEAGRITRFLKKHKFTEEDIAKIPYIIEGQFPGGQTIDEFLKDVKNADKLIEASTQFSDLLSKIGLDEISAGALKSMRKGYFPHAMLEDPAIQKQVLEKIKTLGKYNLIGRDALNKFASQRNSFKTFAEWDDAIENAKKKLELITDPDKYEQASEALKALEGLFERNVFTAMERRFVKGARSVAMTNLYRDFEKSGAIIKSENLVGKNLQGYTRVDNAIAKSLKYVKEGDFINNEILKGLERMDGLFTDKGFQKFVDGFTSLTNIFKSGVTTYIPRHYVFNAIGNLANNIMAGVTPGAYRKAARLMYKQRNGLLDETEQKFIKMAYEDGILTGGSTTDVADPFRIARLSKELEANGGVSPLNNLAKAERFITDNRYAHTMSQAGHITDNLARLAHYIEMMKKTGSRKLSRESVRKYLYNYNELTNTDKYIKLFAPFWSFTKNNLPRMLMEFAKQPRFFLTYEKLRDAMDRGDDKPDYLNGMFGPLNIGKNKYWNPRLPQEQLGQIEDPGSFGMNLLSPYIKAPFELQANKQFYNGAPVDPYRSDLGGYSPGAVSQYLVGQTGIGNEIYKLFSPEARKNVSVPESAAYSVVGRPTVVDPAQLNRTRFYQMQEYLNKQTQQRLAKARKTGQLQ